MSIGTVLIPEISEEQDVFCAARETFMSILAQLQDALTENVVSRSVYGFFKGGVSGQ